MCFGLASCQGGSPSPPARFEGVTAASGVTFTPSPSRCAISFLYDNFRLEWLSNEQPRGNEELKQSARHIALAASPAAQGRAILLDLRGAAAPGARLNVRVGEQAFEIPLPAAGEFQDFYHRVEARLGAGSARTSIFIEAALPRPNPADQQLLLMIDSVDIALPAEDGCKSVEEEKRAMEPVTRPDSPASAGPTPRAADGNSSR